MWCVELMVKLSGLLEVPVVEFSSADCMLTVNTDDIV